MNGFSQDGQQSTGGGVAALKKEFGNRRLSVDQNQRLKKGSLQYGAGLAQFSFAHRCQCQNCVSVKYGMRARKGFCVFDGHVALR